MNGSNAAFKSSSEVRAYELGGGDYDVVCIQVVLVGKMDGVQNMSFAFYLFLVFCIINDKKFILPYLKKMRN